jgi:hypothetical protein
VALVNFMEQVMLGHELIEGEGMSSQIITGEVPSWDYLQE